MFLVDLVWYFIVGWMIGTLRDTDWSMYSYYFTFKKGFNQ